MPRQKGRKSLRTEIRVYENIEVLSQAVDEDGLATVEALGEQYKTPAEQLTEYWGWNNRATAYHDTTLLEQRGRLETFPPGAPSYKRGYAIKALSGIALRASQESLSRELDRRFQAVKQNLEGSAKELEIITKALGWLGTGETKGPS
jgi:hypothetical protein